MNVATIDAMLAAGVTAEVLAAAWKADITAQTEATEERRAKDRDRQRRHRESRDVTVTGEESRDKGLPEVSPPSPFPNHSKIDPLNPPIESEESEEGLKLKPEHLQEAWNDGPASRGAVACRRMGPDRRRKSISFLRRYPVEDITEAIAAVHSSDFLCGVSKDGFRADIDFLFVSKHMDRLLEGFYAR